ncbi:MAG: glycosyltransferase [Deltaproteobacteria bacterium]|jgi:glycosyltransferase involved in cell wall biosynthesis|nr:glycosyltransferase [Deltaproteobacteria bacterium]
MDISVIVPIYNAKNYLQSCLNALLSQDFKNFEIICVDDGSTDGSSEILDRVEDQRLKVIRQANSGAWPARLAGIAAAKGDYVTFCDSDDRPTPNWLAAMYKRARETGADITVCGFRRVDEATGKIVATEMGLDGVEDVSVNKSPLMFLNSALWNKLFKAKLFENIFKPTIIPRIAEDTLFIASLYPRVNRIAFVSTVLYDYTVRSSSAIANVDTDDIQKTRLAFAELGDLYPQNHKNCLAAIAFIHCAVAMLLLMNKPSSDTIKETYVYLNKYFPTWKKILSLKQVLQSSHKIKLLKIYIVLLCFKLHIFSLFIFVWTFISKKFGITIKW